MKFSHPFLAFLSLGIIVAPFSGCGYTRKTVLPQDIKTLHVDTVRNKVPLEAVYAYEPGLEIKITNAIIRRVERDGNLRIENRENTDAILQANLVRFEQEGLRFTSFEQVEEYRLFIVLSLRLIDRRTKEVIWEEPSFSGEAEYFVSDVRSLSREEAAGRAIERLAKSVVDRIVEDW